MKRSTLTQAGQFTDVPADLWCAENIQTAYEYGIMSGTTATYFDVNSSLTVAQTIVMACRLHSGYTGDNAEFTQATPWYQPYLDYAAENNIVWEFVNYNAPVTRADFAVIAGSALPDEALSSINDIENGDIPDVPEDADYAEAVYRLYNAGVLTGNDAYGTFTPDSYITRGAAAALVSRLADPLPAEIHYAGGNAFPACRYQPTAESEQSQKELHGCGVPSGL